MNCPWSEAVKDLLLGTEDADLAAFYPVVGDSYKTISFVFLYEICFYCYTYTRASY